MLVGAEPAELATANFDGVAEVALELTGLSVGYSNSPGLSPDTNPANVSAMSNDDYVRLLMYKATGGATNLPPLRYLQREWAQANLTQLDSYADVGNYEGVTGTLFLCFIPDRGPKRGHVWLLQQQGNLVSLECAPGIGATSRAWYDEALNTSRSEAYILPNTAGEGSGGPFEPSPDE